MLFDSYLDTSFAVTFEQLFEKLRATFWEISSNLWKALSTILIKQFVS